MAFVSSMSVSRSSFRGAKVSARVPVAGASVRMSMSKSVPFLESPANLDPDAPGFADFDPLNFSNMFSVKWLREAEIKHGRICMLATLGWIVPEFYHLPGKVFSNTSPLSALGTVPRAGLGQILLLIIALEAMDYNRLFYTEGWEPGNSGFDPLNLGRGKNRKRLQTAEIKNGRLAMIAMGGFIHQALLTNQGIIAQLQSGNFSPTRYPLN